MAKILIVDDSAVQRIILKKLLEKENHEIVGEAKSGLNILDLYKKTGPDIVLLDIVMPDANGIALLSKLLEYDKDAKIILCSSTALETIIIDSIKLGAKGFLIKPITGEALIKAVNKVLKAGQL